VFGIGEQCKVLDEHYDDLYHILLVAWTSAGDALFFARRWLVVEGGGAVLPAFQGRYSNLYRLDVETGEVNQVIPLDERPDCWFRVAGVSPDGRWVAYHHDDEDGALYLRELDSGDERHVSDGNGVRVAGARFSPDGSHLAYVEVEGHDQPRFTGGRTLLVDVPSAGQAMVLAEGAGVVDWPVGGLDGETPILDRLDAEGHLGLWVTGESSEPDDLLPGMLAGVLSPTQVG
jgi:Tol biopolymer transport system component